jgi:hypothetical protein
MLTASPSDTRSVIHRALVLASVACCLLVAASFVLFARDQVSGASKAQVAQLATTATPARGAAHPRPRAQPRRFIDNAAHALTSPFESVVSSHNAWVDHGVPAVIALLVYGVGLGYLARYTRGVS